MKYSWEIIINKAAEQELLNFSFDLQARFLRTGELLTNVGPLNVGMPHVKQLEGKLWEMRLSGKDNIARSIYYIGHNKKIIVLHNFIKKTQKTPKNAIKVAKSRMQEI